MHACVRACVCCCCLLFCGFLNMDSLSRCQKAVGMLSSYLNWATFWYQGYLFCLKSEFIQTCNLKQGVFAAAANKDVTGVTRVATDTLR